MKVLRDAPLQTKLTWLAMTCSIVALTTTALGLGVYEWVVYRQVAISHLETISLLTARNTSAALAFDDTEDATRILSALETETAVTAAALYDVDGRIFAEYRRNGDELPFPNRAPADGLILTTTRAEIAKPVMELKRFGTLLVRADLSAVHERLGAYLLVLAGTTVVSGFVALLLADRLKRRILLPIQALATAAKSVQDNADYRIRVSKVENDEVGALADAFNGMLTRIQENEADLHRSGERLRLAVESAKIGTWDWDMLRDEVLWNPRNYEIFGLPVGTPITGGIFMSKVHPEDQLRMRKAMEEAASSSADFSTEFRVPWADHATRHVAARGRFLKSSTGSALRGVGVTIDITERRAAELRVAESEVRFRAVAEKAPALIWSCDPSLKRDYFNSTWLAFTGREIELELGHGWQNGVPELDLQRWHAMVDAAVAARDPYSVEYRLRRTDGALRWMIETGSPRLAADGSFAGYLGSCIDFTARKDNEAELEEHVRARTRELQTANQELESFSYSVSHDLRGPVRAIQGFTEIAVEDCQANNCSAAIERLNRVIKAADRMNKLIDAFISMARITRTEIRMESVNLSKMVEDVIGFLRSAQPAREVQVEIAPNLICMGDGRLLRIVLENLLGNAWKFTTRVDHPVIQFGGEAGPDGETIFYVRDNGAGFDGSLAHKLFQAFQRLHHGSQFEGLGVGLNTVHRVMQRHNGRVWAESAEGKGATFFFALPAVSPAKPNGAAPAT